MYVSCRDGSVSICRVVDGIICVCRVVGGVLAWVVSDTRENTRRLKYVSDISVLCPVMLLEHAIAS